MDFAKIMTIAISAMFINNFVVARFLGLCPFMGVSKQTRPALCMSAAVIFVISGSSVITWLLYNYMLIPLKLEYMSTIAFILVIAVFVQFVDMAMLKFSAPLHRALGIYLPLITTNCAVLGVAVLNVNMFFKDGRPLQNSLANSFFQAFFASLGFALAMMLMSGIRERLDLEDAPKSLEGLPLAFIVAALMSIAFLGFSGFKF
ncbi:MAG: RnfABCDGE type electron transport complex subunit A [Candidatus Omnitrophota bacterium]